MLYHVSSNHGLKTIEPRKSTHGKAYVYAVENRVTGLIFGARKDDFDFMLCTNHDDIPEISECYPDSFRKIYLNKSCSVYELGENGFLRGMTNWNSELVSEQPALVVNETVIDDLYTTLLDEELNGNIIINRYSDSMDYKEKISTHIVDRLIRFDLLNRVDKDERFQKYYSKIITALLDIMDGRYL